MTSCRIIAHYGVAAVEPDEQLLGHVLGASTHRLRLVQLLIARLVAAAAVVAHARVGRRCRGDQSACTHLLQDKQCETFTLLHLKTFHLFCVDFFTKEIIAKHELVPGRAMHATCF